MKRTIVTLAAAAGLAFLGTGIASAATVYGTPGDDHIVTMSGSDYVDAGAGNDYVSTGGGDDTIYGGSGNDELRGGGGNDYINGGPGQDYIDGGGGNDTIDAADGEADTIVCGSGYDSVTADPFDSVSSDCENVTFVS